MQHSQLSDTSDRSREEWIERLWISGNEEDQTQLIEAIDLMLDVALVDRDKHIPLSLDVADILRNLQVDQVTLIAAILSDVRLSDTYSVDSIAEKIQ